MAGPGQAALVAAVSALLALLLPPLAWLSGGVISLITLHLGEKKGIQVMLFASLGTAALSWFVLGTPLVALVMLMVLWLPVWLVSWVLKNSVSLALTLQLITGLSVLLVLVFHLVYPDLLVDQGQVFKQAVEQMMANQSDSVDKSQLNQAVDTVLRWLPGIMASGLLFGVVLSLLLGRGWQAALYNPGGLAREFNELRLGRSLSVVGLLLLLMAGFTSSDLVIMLILVVLSVYLIQGLALIHGILAARGVHKAWLLGFYIMMFLLPQLVLMPLAVFGLTDTWIDFRKRLTV
ncbi:MAG: YybS family protein [Gammaproteobacteria bacterium]|nr:YybS family protein [Gammaproteobacteria bacterium]MCW9056412.1 YybS family protein [Gammaproteobacteria bacterium]